jgi:hypothetical protein
MAVVAQDKNYFQQVVAVTENYLGPASERFVRRQVEFHLDKQPDELKKADIPRLSASIEVALGLLVDDKSVVSAAVKDLQKIQ